MRVFRAMLTQKYAATLQNSLVVMDQICSNENELQKVQKI